MGTHRVEAFSDGVFAIAITLLILEIKVPHLDHAAGSAELVRELLNLWPSYVAFLMSFFVVLVMWVNHHGLFDLVRKVDYPFQFANGFLLLMVTFVPFPTAVMAQHLDSPAANAAAAFYCGTFIVISLAYNLLFHCIAHRRRLVREEVTDATLRRVRIAYWAGLGVYVTSTALAAVSAALGLMLCVSLWVVWVCLGYSDRTMPHANPQAG